MSERVFQFITFTKGIPIMSVQKFTFYCLAYAILGAYCLSIGFTYPLTGLSIKKLNTKKPL